MYKEATLLLLVKVLIALLGFTVTAIIARTFSSDDVGTYFLLLSLVNFIIPLSLAGLGYQIIKLGSSNGDCIAFSIVFVLVSSIFIGLLLLTLNYFGLFFSNVMTKELMQLFVPLLIINCLADYLSYLFQSIKRAWLGSITLILIRHVILILLLSWSDIVLLKELFQCLFIAGGVSLIISFYYLSRVIEIRFSNLDFSIKYVKDSIDFMINHLMATINGSFLPIMIGIISSQSQLAYFAIALRVVSLSSFIMIPLNRVVAPRYSESFNKGELNEFHEIARFSSRLAALLTVPLIGGLFVFSEYILAFFGDSYIEESLLILQIMLLGQFFNCMSGSVGWLLQMTNNEKLYRNISLYNLLFTFLLALLLVHYFGGIGAGIAYSFSLFFMNTVSFYYVKKIFNINIYKIW